MRVLGIDPGLRITGYACVAGSVTTPELSEAGVFRLAPPSGPTPDVPARLAELEADLRDAIERAAPDLMAVEALFAHGRFPATAIAMGHARGVVLLTARRAGLDVIELPPKSVKMAMTGSGRASKRQMQAAAQSLFGLPEPPEPPDIADAIAIALAGLARA